MMIVLYDGWPLCYDPNSPAALSLLALLAHSPAGVQPHVALPAIPPGNDLPPNALSHVLHTPNTSAGLLRWEHTLLPKLARRLHVDLLHLSKPGAALFSPVPAILSPVGYWEEGATPKKHETLTISGFYEANDARSFLNRLCVSLGEGGLTRLSGLIWPAHIPLPEGRLASIPVYRAPAAVHPSFSPPSLFSSEDLSSLNLPDTFVLYHGPHTPNALRRLLSAWSWAAKSIGDHYPLVLPGMTSSDQAFLGELARDYSLTETVLPLPPVPLSSLAEMYRACAALFHPLPISPWGSSVRHALACERPIVAAENRFIDALVGPAAYLVSATDPRALGAAIITVVVEEEVSERLIQAAHQRAAHWNAENFSAALWEAYQAVIYST